MTELVKFMIQQLVDNKDEVAVTQGEDNTITVKVSKDDMGKVIGKDGRIAKAIRTIVKAVAAKEEKRVTIEFIG